MERKNTHMERKSTSMENGSIAKRVWKGKAPAWKIKTYQDEHGKEKATHIEEEEEQEEQEEEEEKKHFPSPWVFVPSHRRRSGGPRSDSILLTRATGLTQSGQGAHWTTAPSANLCLTC